MCVFLLLKEKSIITASAPSSCAGNFTSSPLFLQIFLISWNNHSIANSAARNGNISYIYFWVEPYMGELSLIVGWILWRDSFTSHFNAESANTREKRNVTIVRKLPGEEAIADICIAGSQGILKVVFIFFGWWIF